MKTKKIFAAALAGLCAVSAMGVSAFAADDTTAVKEAGEKAYKITAGFQAPTMDVTVPTEIKGVINPYKISIKLDGKDTEAEGIASPRYAITNNSTEVGVKVNATYSADGLDGIVDTQAKAEDPDVNTKGQKLAYVTLNAALGTDAVAETTKAMSSEEATVEELLKLDTKGGANGDSGEIWIGGAVIETPAEKWTTKDKLTINVVLDLVPYNTGAGGGSSSDPIDTAMTAISFTSDSTAPTTTAFDAGTTAYTLAGGSAGDELTFTATAASGYTVTYSSTNGNGQTKTDGIIVLKSGTNTIVVTVTDDADNTKTKAYTYTLTLA